MIKKKGMEIQVLGWWILGLAILVILVIAFLYLRNNGSNALEFLKNLFRLRAA